MRRTLLLSALIVGACAGDDDTYVSPAPATMTVTFGSSGPTETWAIGGSPGSFAVFRADEGVDCSSTYTFFQKTDDDVVNITLFSSIPIAEGASMAAPAREDMNYTHNPSFMLMYYTGDRRDEARKLFGGSVSIEKWSSRRRVLKLSGASWHFRPEDEGSEEVVEVVDGDIDVVWVSGDNAFEDFDSTYVSTAPLDGYVFEDGSLPCSFRGQDSTKQD